jgi:UDP-N-acetylmuramate dehydrogenase
VDLAPYTYIRIGGRADVLWEVRSRDDLGRALADRRERDAEECLVIGGGANLLINDERTYPFVVKIERQLGEIHEQGDRVVAEAGASLSRLVRTAAQAGWGGFEMLAGVPGTVGGAVVMNAGIPAFETFDLVREVWGVDAAGRESRFRAEELRPSYRHGGIPPDVVVTHVAFERRPGDPAAMAETARRLKDERRAKQPLQLPSFGSTFRNPRPPADATPADARGTVRSGWGSGAAGALIERAGLKGARRGDAQLSEIHANFVVNLGRARARDVLDLMILARRAVAEKFGVRLVPEVRLVGFSREELAPLIEGAA